MQGIVVVLPWFDKYNAVYLVWFYDKGKKATETTDAPIRFSWNIWQALVSLMKFEIKYFHSLNTLPVRSTSHRVQTSRNVVIHSFTSRRGSWLAHSCHPGMIPCISMHTNPYFRQGYGNAAWMPICKSPAKWFWMFCEHCSKLHHYHTVDRIACTTECDGPLEVRMLLGSCGTKLCMHYKSIEVCKVW